ncbi:MAG: hypothetical protein ACTSU3_08230 [Candidatus Thorarchaeota archaeon]
MDKWEKLYTPLVLRTGIFHSYTRTIAPWIVLNLTSFIVLLIAGMIIDPLGVLIVFAFTFILIAGTWTVRCAVSSFDELFDVFDEDTENRLNLYRSIYKPATDKPATDKPATGTQEKVKSIFIKSEDYTNFRTKIQNAIFSRNEAFYLGVLSIALIVVNIYYYLDPATGYYNGFLVFPWTNIHAIIWISGIAGYLVIFGMAALWIIFRFFAIIKVVDNSKGFFKVSAYIEYLQGGAQSENDVMPYHTFYNTIALVGEKIYRITSMAVITLVLAVMWIIGNSVINLGNVDIVAWILSIVMIPLTFLVFTTPQWLIHSTLANLKSAILEATLEEYDRKKLVFTSLVRSKTSSFLTDTESSKLVRPLYDSLLGMQILSSDMEEAPTWTFKMPTALKLVATSLLPIIAAISQPYLLSLLETLP